MKHQLTAILATLGLLGNVEANQPRPITPVDPSRVFSSGSTTSAPAAARFALQPGVYELGRERGTTGGDYLLLVDDHINDPDLKLGILIDRKSSRSGRTGVGGFYQIIPIQGGTVAMLSPIFLDPMTGAAVVMSMTQSNAPVITISIAPEVATGSTTLRYPYIVQGFNGALIGDGSSFFEMRAKSHQRPMFRVQPKSGVFESSIATESRVVVQSNNITLHSQDRVARQFTMTPLNGELGKMAYLSTSSLDTRSESMIVSHRYQRLAFFLSTDRQGFSDADEFFVVATPSPTPGVYVFDFYGPRGTSFLDRWFPGQLSPNDNRNGGWLSRLFGSLSSGSQHDTMGNGNDSVGSQ